MADPHDPIRSFRPLRTARLVLLAVITLGIYCGHYAARQTRALRDFLADEQAGMLTTAARLVTMTGYVTLACLALLLLAPLKGPVQLLCVVTWLSWSAFWLLSHAFWSLRFCQLLNDVRDCPPASSEWFDGSRAFLLPSLYLNHKLNLIAARGRQ